MFAVVDLVNDITDSNVKCTILNVPLELHTLFACGEVTAGCIVGLDSYILFTYSIIVSNTFDERILAVMAFNITKGQSIVLGIIGILNAVRCSCCYLRFLSLGVILILGFYDSDIILCQLIRNYCQGIKLYIFLSIAVIVLLIVIILGQYQQVVVSSLVILCEYLAGNQFVLACIVFFCIFKVITLRCEDQTEVILAILGLILFNYAVLSIQNIAVLDEFAPCYGVLLIVLDAVGSYGYFLLGDRGLKVDDLSLIVIGSYSNLTLLLACAGDVVIIIA